MNEGIKGGIEDWERDVQLNEIILWKLLKEVKGKYCACGVVAELWIAPVNEQMRLFLVYIVNR